MKFKLLLLKAWKNGDKDIAAGTIIEVTDKALASQLILDGIAEMDKTPDVKSVEDISKLVDAGVKKALESADLHTKIAQQVHSITIKDLVDDDPSFGYLAPHADGKEHTKNEKMWGLGLFGADVGVATTVAA